MTCLTLLLATLTALGDSSNASADPTRPDLVAVDFHDEPVLDVARAIAAGGGNTLTVMAIQGEPIPNVTLAASEPMPFWEAVDRLCASTGLQRRMTGGGGQFRSSLPSVELHGPTGGGDAGPALYAGPFRLGPFALHRQEDRAFVPSANRREASSFHAEFAVLVEPRVIAVRTGPVRPLEAVDDAGRSLVPTGPGDVTEPASGYPLVAGTIRVPLARPRDPGGRLRRLRGVIPVELGLRPSEPSLVVPMAGASGKTFHADDLSIDVREFRIDPRGLAHIKLTVRIEGERGRADKVPRGVLSARAMTVLNSQLELVDGRGKLVTASGGASATGPLLAADYTYRLPGGAHPGQPVAVQLRVFTPRWVAWEVPFEFGGLPLP